MASDSVNITDTATAPTAKPTGARRSLRTHKYDVQSRLRACDRAVPESQE
jgi:hypothetical protein